MSLTINSSVGSLIIQKDLKNAREVLARELERISVKYNNTDNKVKDKEVNEQTSAQLNTISVVQDCITTGASILSATSKAYDEICEKLENAKADFENADKYINEIQEIIDNTEFDGNKLLDGTFKTVVVYTDIDTDDKLVIDSSVLTDVNPVNKDNINETINKLNDYKSKINAYQQKLDDANSKLEIRYANVSSSVSTLKDTDVVSDSSDYLKTEILKQASDLLSSVTNQKPNIAINLM